jgi:putative MFS transporter
VDEAPEEAARPVGLTGAYRVRSWRDRRVVAVAVLALAAGFGQFGVVAALGDVARSFGHLSHGVTLADQAGLTGTKLGIGLAVIRLASLAGLPVAAAADRLGRRRTLIGCVAAGLAMTALSALSPGYWWFVVIFAVGRPFLSATNALANVCAAEETASSGRSRAVALVAGGYGLGAGLTAFIHGLAHSVLGFRGVVALTLVPLMLLPLIARSVEEPDRFAREAGRPHMPVLAAVGPEFRARLAVVAGLSFALSVITGPANSFAFLYAQNVVRLSGGATSAMVALAAVTGLSGLLLGRFLADSLGRRPAAAGSIAAMAGFGVLTYSGSRPGLVVGYVLGVLAASTLAPAAGAFVNELFPTQVRASIAGWQLAAAVLGASTGLVVFGQVADVDHQFGTAAVMTFLPALGSLGLLLLLPETRGRELEELWPSAAAQG